MGLFYYICTMAEKRNTITAVVQHFLKVKLKEPGLHRLEEVLGVALWGLREISLDNGGHLQTTTVLNMSATKTIQMPAGFIDWNAIGIIAGGSLQFISKSEELISLHTAPYPFKTGVKTPELTYSGILNSSDKFFVVDWDSKLIKFSSAVTTAQVYLDYITDGLGATGNTFVHPYIQNYLLKYLEKELLPNANSGAELYHAEAVARARNSDLMDVVGMINLFKETNPKLYGGI